MQTVEARQETCVSERSRGTIRRVSSAKSLTKEQQARVREGLLRIVKDAGSQKKAAAILGVTQQTVNANASGVHEPGVMLASKLAKALGQTYEELVDGIPPSSRPITYRQLPGWEEAADEVIARSLQRRGVVLRASALTVPFAPERVDVRLVLDVCALWLTHAPLAERIAVETAEAQEDLKRSGH